MGPQRPCHARHLVGERYCHDLEGSPRQELREPGIFFRVLILGATAIAATRIQRLMLVAPRPEPVAEPEELCLIDWRQGE
jgi:hypothetical protein